MAGDPATETVCWPLQRTHAALSELEGPNDGLVPVDSALAFGTPLPAWPLDHLRQMNWLAPGETDSLFPPPIELYARVVALSVTRVRRARTQNGEEKAAGSVTSQAAPRCVITSEQARRVSASCLLLSVRRSSELKRR